MLLIMTGVFLGNVLTAWFVYGMFQALKVKQLQDAPKGTAFALLIPIVMGILGILSQLPT